MNELQVDSHYINLKSLKQLLHIQLYIRFYTMISTEKNFKEIFRTNYK
jgi:hypothetical protein